MQKLENLSDEDEPPSFKVQNNDTKVDNLFNVINQKTRQFIDINYSQVTDAEWNDWHWQIKNRIQTIEDLGKYIKLSKDEEDFFVRSGGSFPFAITPYYLSLVDKDDPKDGVRMSVIPTVSEYDIAEDEADDPLGEEHDSPVKSLVHRYPNRVLFLATDFCSTCCRYCTRSRLIGNVHRENCYKHWDEAIEYIKQHTEVEDVLISGGDPLTLPINILEGLLQKLKKINHIKYIRIGTKVPVVLPQRITTELTDMLKKYHPLFISIHFTHPKELTEETKEACTRLADAGIPLGSQTVLLKGINDDAKIMRNLMMGLLSFRVRPYYLYQCDPIAGSKHFRTSVQKGLDIMRSLRGFISGYAIPAYVIDAPGGGGKTPILPDYFQGKEGNNVILKNYEGKIYKYPDSEES